MKKPLKPRAKAFGFSLVITILSWMSLASYWSTHQLVSSFDAVTQAHQALEMLQHIEMLMESAESSVRGYVITGEAKRLTPFRYARLVVPYQLKQVEEHVAQHPLQLKHVIQLNRLLAAHLSLLAGTVERRRTKGYEAAAQWILTEDDTSKRNAMDHLLSEVQQEEWIQLRQRGHYTSENSLKTNIVLTLATVVTLGLVAWVFGMLRQETEERHQAESATQRSETFLHSIIERLPYMIMVKEAENLRLTLVNKAAEEWLGRSRGELTGSNEFDLRIHDQPLNAIQKDRHALQGWKSVDIPEESLKVQGKEERIVHTQKIPIPDENGNPGFLLTISEDITQRKQAEKILQLSRDAALESAHLKSEFIRNMSHEFRTPLAIIIGMTSLLLDMELTPDQRRFASTVQRAAEGLSVLTKTILDFSKMEAGTFALETQEVNVRQIVEGVITMMSEQAKAKGVGLAALIYNEIPSVVMGDPIRLRQVLTQLIGNAVKFTGRGEVIIRITEAKQNDSQVWLECRITDTGIGITPDAQEHIFEAFRQADGSRTRRFGGTGMGLAISKRIVELMGGEIGFESTEGQGSVFWCTIPFMKRNGKGPMVQVASQPWAQARVLVVDENETYRHLLQQQLNSWALSSEGVSGGQAALDFLRREHKAGRPFPMMLIDMHLSDMDAVSLVRALRSDALSKIKVLVMTSSGAALEPSAAASLGFAGSVAKPVQPEELYERLVALIDPSLKSSDREHAA
jgi:PAS domain S-box-containing protein